MAINLRAPLITNATFVEEQERLYEGENRTDAVIEAGTFSKKVHMAVVCTRSDYFEKAFQTGMKEGQAKSIEITDDDQHYVEALVKYLYILDYTIGPEDVSDLVQHAEMFRLGNKFLTKGLCELAVSKMLQRCESLGLPWDAKDAVGKCTFRNGTLVEDYFRAVRIALSCPTTYEGSIMRIPFTRVGMRHILMLGKLPEFRKLISEDFPKLGTDMILRLIPTIRVSSATRQKHGCTCCGAGDVNFAMLRHVCQGCFLAGITPPKTRVES